MALVTAFLIQNWNDGTSSWDTLWTVLRAGATVDAWPTIGAIVAGEALAGYTKVQVIDNATGISLLQIDRTV